jgi:C1A family cysteine protease
MSRTIFHKYGLGLKKSIDSNDRRFLVSVPPSMPERTRRWRRGPTLDQGGTSKCVEFAAKAMLMAEPYQHSVKVILDLLDRLYEDAQDNDEWDGHDYDGTSTRGAMKALQNRQLITNYWWITSEVMLRRYVRSISPVMCGFPWFASMFTPNAQGIVTVEGGEEGGHEVCCLWYDPTVSGEPDGLYVFQNSWGEEWGQKGLFYMRPGDVRMLLEDLGGEATVAPEVKLRVV